jgi:hypothetical protein
MSDKEFMSIFTTANSEPPAETIRGVPEAVYRKYLKEAHRRNVAILARGTKRRPSRRLAESSSDLVRCVFKASGACGCAGCVGPQAR